LLLSIGLGFHELAMTGGFYFSHSDVAGPFSGIVFGMTNTVAQIPGFANTVLVAWLTKNVRLKRKNGDDYYNKLRSFVCRALLKSGTSSSTLRVWPTQSA
jgi:hypothetical protein